MDIEKIMADPEVMDALKGIGDVWETGLREAMTIPSSWRYISATLTNSDFDRFLECLEEENFAFVSSSSRSSTNSTRFSIFVSENGIVNLKTFVHEGDDIGA